MNYTYDALGRIVVVSNSGGPASGQNVALTYDAAGNRSNFTVTGAPAFLSIGNASATEGANLVFTVTRSGATSTAVSASWSTANGTASAGSDYTAASGSVSFAAGETSKTITIATTDDTAVEATETMTVNLSSPSADTTITTATGTGTIYDNDASLSISAASTTEGGALIFTVTRAGATSSAVSASWSTSEGTALAGSDYNAASGTVSFAAGETSKTINIATINDSVVEGTESMAVNLSSPSGATITGATGTGTIYDDDASLAITGAIATEGGSLVFTVTRTGNTASAVSATWGTADGSAIAGSDYAAASGTVSFAAGVTTQTITVATINDTVVESAEAMSVSLWSPSANTSIATATASGTIYDNDASLSISNASVTEGGGYLVFTVTRSGNTASAVSANWSTADGSAISGSDYYGGSGTISFAAGETSKTIGINTINDTVVEGTETMTVSLSSPSADTSIGTATGTGTIYDNDASLSISSASVTEGGGYLVFTVTRSGNTGSAVSANWSTADGSAISGSDYYGGSGTISFAAGETSKTIGINTINDTVVEGAETMSLTLSSPSADASIATATGTGTIYDNDASLSISGVAVTEGGNLVFTVTRSGNTASAVSATWGTADGSAVSGGDYYAASGSVTFAAGVTTQTITVSTINDSVVEGTETLAVNLWGPSADTAIAVATATGTIYDDDASLSINNASAPEWMGVLVFTVTRTGNTTSAVSANWSTADGSAVAGSDYYSASGTVSFAPGETSKTISVSVINDTAVESDETMVVSLSSPSANASIATATGTGTIVNDDTAWTSSLTSVTASYYGVVTYKGFVAGTQGSMSNTSFNGYTITAVVTRIFTSGSYYIEFIMTGSSPPNSGWTSITIPGAGTFTRASATYSGGSGSASWRWPYSNNISSGTVQIQ